MITLDDLRFVEALSRTGSLSAASRALNVTPPALSMRLKKLESLLGVSLVIRSSRHLRFTSEGERLVSEAQTLLRRVEALPQAMKLAGDDLAGRLRIVAPFGFGRAHIAPLVARFWALHPALRPELELSDNPWRASRGADVVIHIGELRDSSWVAHLLARNARWVCASPAYLNRAGVPAHPRELLQHTCLAVQENEEDVTLWHFRKHARDRGKASPAEAVRVTPALTSNDGEVVRSWAVAGLGCVLRSEWDAAPLIKRGNLRRILSAWDFEPADVVALVPARRGISARVDGFVQFLKQHFQKPPWH